MNKMSYAFDDLFDKPGMDQVRAKLQRSFDKRRRELRDRADADDSWAFPEGEQAFRLWFAECLDGLPDLHAEPPGSASAQQAEIKQLRKAAQTIIRDLRRDHSEGFIDVSLWSALRPLLSNHSQQDRDRIGSLIFGAESFGFDHEENLVNARLSDLLEQWINKRDSVSTRKGERPSRGNYWLRGAVAHLESEFVSELGEQHIREIVSIVNAIFMDSDEPVGEDTVRSILKANRG